MHADQVALLAEFGLLPEQRVRTSARTLAARRPRGGLKAPRLRLLGRRGKIRIYLVDSTKTRLLYNDWTMGGHSLVYGDWMPPEEVWIADELGPFERRLTTLHELVEMRLMRRGMPYDLAHHQATQIEAGYRERGGRGLDAALRSEDGGASSRARRAPLRNARGGKARLLADPVARLSYRKPWDPNARGGRGGWRPFIRATMGKSGAYVVKHADGAYVGSSDSKRLYRTLVRHFEEWGRDKEFWADAENRTKGAPGETFDREAVEVAVLVCPAERAHALEAELIRRLRSATNEQSPPGEAVAKLTTDEVPF